MRGTVRRQSGIAASPEGRVRIAMTTPSQEHSTAVLDVRGLYWASEQNVVAAVLGRRPGVLEVEVNPVAQTATVVFDPGRTSLPELRGWVTECGYHCAGQSVPAHVCDPMASPDPPIPVGAAVPVAGPGAHPAPAAPGGHAVAQVRSPHEAMGHGRHGEMSMASMAAD